MWWSSTSSNETKEVAVNQKKGEDLTEYVNPEDLVNIIQMLHVCRLANFFLRCQ